MIRFLFSLFTGLVVGLVIGLYLGWVQFPVKYIDSPASKLSQRYRDEYTLMVASGFQVDADPNGAIQRLRILGEDNAPEYVRMVVERYISNSRDVNNIRLLVALYEGMVGRVTPIMEPYQQVTVPEPG
jgi:hypothetical protein